MSCTAILKLGGMRPQPPSGMALIQDWTAAVSSCARSPRALKVLTSRHPFELLPLPFPPASAAAMACCTYCTEANCAATVDGITVERMAATVVGDDVGMVQF